MNDQKQPTHALPELIRVKSGYYRLGKVHFEHVDVEKEACAACSGSGKDPANRRRKCRICTRNLVGKSGPVRPSVNAEYREGYRFSILGNGRDLADCLAPYLQSPGDNDINNLSLCSDPSEPASFVYYLEEGGDDGAGQPDASH
ncbi:hypothetical protein [Tautonia marina]|uniref:hypothetical protein n=1 Tax=Tautonia marina TaxID=2653855 RepID=UPI0012604231|nr:hypothetical protein [Tautonia marina]